MINFINGFKNNIDYDNLFKDIDSNVMGYLKNNHKLTKYIELRQQKYSVNDTLWSIYNDIKLQAEFNNEIWTINSALNYMGNLLTLENKDTLDYCLSAFYISCYNLNNNDYGKRLGTTKNREIKILLKDRNLSFELFKTSILELIPKYYDVQKVNDVYNFLINNLK